MEYNIHTYQFNFWIYKKTNMDWERLKIMKFGWKKRKWWGNKTTFDKINIRAAIMFTNNDIYMNLFKVNITFSILYAVEKLYWFGFLSCIEQIPL